MELLGIYNNCRDTGGSFQYTHAVHAEVMTAYEDKCPDWTKREQTSVLSVIMTLVLTAAAWKSHVKTNVSDVSPSGKEGRRLS